MAKYTPNTQVEADVFTVSKEDKKALDERKQVNDVNGVRLRKDGDTYYGFVDLADGTTARVEEGSYIVKEAGRSAKVVSKEDFSANYSPYKGKATTDEPVAYAHDISGDTTIVGVAGGGIDPATPDKEVPHFSEAGKVAVPESAPEVTAPPKGAATKAAPPKKGK